MAGIKVIKTDVTPEMKQRFSEFCKKMELKEAEVVRKAVKSYMTQQTPRTLTLTFQKGLT